MAESKFKLTYATMFNPPRNYTPVSTKRWPRLNPTWVKNMA